MARKKVKLVLISNKSARKSCLKKRRVGLLKKVSELTVLCGVDAFCIILSPDDREPVTWPSPLSLQNVIANYLKLPNSERCKKSMNQESYLKERIGKAEDLSMKNLKKNKDIDLCRYMHQLHLGKLLDDFVGNELASFAWLVQEKIINISKRMEYFDQVPPHHSFESFSAYHVGGDHRMVSPCDALHLNQSSAKNLMKTNDIPGDESTTHDDTRVLLGFNMNTPVSNILINMAIYNSFYKDMGFPNIVKNFNGGGLATNNVTYGSNTMGIKLPRKALTTGVDYGTRFGFLEPTHSNFLRFGNNIENANAISLGMPYGSWEIGGNHQMPPYNGVESGILGRKLDYQIVMLNENTNLEFGNGIGARNHTTNFAANIGGNDSHIGLGQLNYHIGSDINSEGGSIERNCVIGSQYPLFVGTSDVQCLNTTLTTNNNNLTP